MRRVLSLILPATLCGAVALPAVAHACSVCGCGDPLVDIASAEASPGRFGISLTVEQLTASAQSDEEPDRTEDLSQLTIRPALAYSPTDYLNLALQVPLVRKDWSLSASQDEAEESSTRFGLGDLDLGASLFVWDHTNWEAFSRQSLAVSAGTSFPTGPDNAVENGQRIDDHAQLGTGSFGPYAGLLYAFRRDPWNLYASVNGRFHTTNRFDYHYASSLQWTVRGDWQPLPWLAGELGLDGRVNGRDTAEGEDQVHTGGFVLAASPGALVRIVSNDLWLHLRVQIPVVTVLNGEQTVGPTFLATLRYSFDGS